MESPPLHAAVRAGDVVQLRELLQEGGAEVETGHLDSGGWAALHAAADGGHHACVVALLDAGADMNQTAALSDATPLMLAAHNGHTECVATIIEAGAYVNKVDAYLSTALMNAVEESHWGCASLLITGGADVNLVDRSGRSALLAAAERGGEQCVDLLLAAGATVNLTRLGTSPLVNTAWHGQSACLRKLLEAGANVNQTDREGDTALVSAVQAGSTECVDILLKVRTAHVVSGVVHIRQQ